MFMLESHLSVPQNKVVSLVQEAATSAGMGVFLTGGAMRDMLGGFHIRDLDFAIEGRALALLKPLTAAGARIGSQDDRRKSAELVFPGGVTAQIAMARRETRSRTGKLQIAPGTIQEDLRWRDFTVNSIALALNRSSRGLLIDPNNGLADLERRELRTLQSTTFYDDPVRLLRAARLRLRLGFSFDEKTAAQYANAREAGTQASIAVEELGRELLALGREPAPSEVVRVLDQDGLMTLFSPALQGPKLNLAALAKLERARRLFPPEVESAAADPAPFLWVLTEKLTPKEKSALIRTTAMTRSATAAWQALPARATKLAAALQKADLKRPSLLYAVLAQVPAPDLLFLLYHSSIRIVHDRAKNYLQKYLPLAQEVTPGEVEAALAAEGRPADPQSSEFRKKYQALIADRVDGKTRKPEPPPPPPLDPRTRAAVARAARGRA